MFVLKKKKGKIKNMLIEKSFLIQNNFVPTLLYLCINILFVLKAPLTCL